MYHLIRSLYLHATSKEEYSVILLGLDNAGKTTLLSQIKAIYNTLAEPELGKTGDAPTLSTAGDTVPTVGQNVATIDMPDMYLKIWDVGGQMSLRRLWTSYYKSAHAVVFVVDSSDLGTLDEELVVEAMDGDGAGGGGSGMLSPQTPTMMGAAAGPRGWHGRRKSSYAFPTTQGDLGTTMTNSSSGGGGGEGGGVEAAPPMPIITPGMVTGSGAHQGRLDECRAVLESVLGHEDMTGIPILVLANKQDREDSLEVVRIKEGFVRPVFEGEKGTMVRDSRVLPVSALKGTGVKEAVEWLKTRVVWNKDGRAPVMR